MNKTELVRTVANLTELPKVTVSDVLSTAFDVIAETLAAGDEAVTVPRLGKFKSIRRAQRIMRLPFSGEDRIVGGKRVSKFVASSEFRKRVNGES